MVRCRGHVEARGKILKKKKNLNKKSWGIGYRTGGTGAMGRNVKKLSRNYPLPRTKSREGKGITQNDVWNPQGRKERRGKKRAIANPTASTRPEWQVRMMPEKEPQGTKEKRKVLTHPQNEAVRDDLGKRKNCLCPGR